MGVSISVIQSHISSLRQELCENDMVHQRLAAAKSILLLSRRWEIHISPHIFRSTIMMAKDSSLFGRKSFLDKTYKLLKGHATSCKFACAFPLAASDSDCVKDLRDKSLKYLIEFIKEYSKVSGASSTSDKEGSMTDSPAYIVVFFLHILAHDAGFPDLNTHNEEHIAQSCRPLLLLLHVLVNSQCVDGDLELVKKNFLCLRSIFLAIRRAEDAVDPDKTPTLHLLAEIGMSVLNALRDEFINLSRAPGLVLLPSSLYKTSETKRTNENPVESLVNEDLQRKLFQVLDSNLIQLSSSTGKRSRKYVKDCLEGQKFFALPISKQLSKGVKIDEMVAEKRMASTCVLEACPKGKEQSAIARSSLKTLQLQDGSSNTKEVEADGSGDITPLGEKENHLDSETAAVELFDIESDISTQGVDVSMKSLPLEQRKRKSNCLLTESLDRCETNTRQVASSDGSTVSFSRQCGPKKQCSSDNGSKKATVSGEGGARTQGSGMNQRKILLDRTNSLSVNGFSKHCQPKNRSLGHKVSLDTSESDVSHENKDAVAFRTRRRRV